MKRSSTWITIGCQIVGCFWLIEANGDPLSRLLGIVFLLPGSLSTFLPPMRHAGPIVQCAVPASLNLAILAASLWLTSKYKRL